MSKTILMCPRCRNTDRRYFYKGSRGLYCRRCISFSRMLVEEELHPTVLRPIAEESAEYLMPYPLTPAQAQISRQCAELISRKDVLLYAATGARQDRALCRNNCRVSW